MYTNFKQRKLDSRFTYKVFTFDIIMAYRCRKNNNMVHSKARADVQPQQSSTSNNKPMQSARLT